MRVVATDKTYVAVRDGDVKRAYHIGETWGDCHQLGVKWKK